MGVLSRPLESGGLCIWGCRPEVDYPRSGTWAAKADKCRGPGPLRVSR